MRSQTRVDPNYGGVDPNWIHVLAVRFRDSAGRPNKPTPLATLHGVLDVLVLQTNKQTTHANNNKQNAA